MFEFLFVALILMHGEVIGMHTYQYRTAQLCEDVRARMVVAMKSPELARDGITVKISPCERTADA